jgi:hypothetical protein
MRKCKHSNPAIKLAWQLSFLFFLAFLTAAPNIHSAKKVWIGKGPADTGGIIEAVAIDPSAPQTVYAATYSGVFKSTNGGSNWIAVNTGLSNSYVRALAIDPSMPQIVYAGTSRMLKNSPFSTNFAR